MPTKGKLTPEAERRLKRKAAEDLASKQWKIIALLIVTIVLTNLPDFHLEEYLGMEYAWWFDMLQHGGYYLVATLTLFHLLPYQKRSYRLFLIVFGISAALEFSQLLVDGRSFSMLDLTSNFLGILLAFVFRWIWGRITGYYATHY